MLLSNDDDIIDYDIPIHSQQHALFLETTKIQKLFSSLQYFYYAVTIERLVKLLRLIIGMT